MLTSEVGTLATYGFMLAYALVSLAAPVFLAKRGAQKPLTLGPGPPPASSGTRSSGAPARAAGFAVQFPGAGVSVTAAAAPGEDSPSTPTNRA